MQEALRITIQSLPDATETLAGDPDAKQFPHVISMGDPDSSPPPGLGNRHSLRIICHDVDWDTGGLEGLTHPAPEDSASIIEFGRQVLAKAEQTGERQSVLLHCRAGISRSTAAALMLLYLDESRAEKTELDKGAEGRAGERLLAERPKALPNRSLIRFADEILSSRLFDIVEEIHEDWAAKVRAMLGDLRQPD